MTQLTHTNRRERDIRAAREPKDQRVGDGQGFDRGCLCGGDARGRGGDEEGGGEPEGEGSCGAEGEGGDHAVEAAEAVGYVACEEAAQAGSGVEEGEELVGECWGEGGGGGGEGG